MLQVLPPQRLCLHRCRNAVTTGEDLLSLAMPSLYFGGRPLYSAPLFIKYGFGLLIAGKSLILLVKYGWLSPRNRMDTSQGMRVLLVTGIY